LYREFATAFVRGRQQQGDALDLPAELCEKPLADLTPPDIEKILSLGLAFGLRLHKFKRTMGLVRVQKVLGILRGIAPTELLDIGSGRGTFLWPLLEAFPDVPVTAIDAHPQRASDLAAVRLGGVSRLQTAQREVQALDLPDASHDGATMLEVLEHLPQPVDGLREVVRVARRFVVLSCPSQADDNPDHLHLYTREELHAICREAGLSRTQITQVPGHYLVTAWK